MSTTFAPVPQITCGNCKRTHHSVGEVRDCYRGAAPRAVSRPHPALRPALRPVSAAPSRPLVAPQTPTAPAPAPPTRRAVPDVPAGRYAVLLDGEVKFYRVSVNEKHGRTWRNVYAIGGDTEYPIRNFLNMCSVLDKIVESKVETSSKLYGVMIGTCGVCGRTLTDPESRALGVGPICRERMGW